MSRTYSRITKAALLALSGSMVACSGSSSSDSASTTAPAPLVISGSLSSNDTASLKLSRKQDFSANAVSLAGLEIYAIAFTSPPVIAKADVGSDGSFTLNVPGAKGASVTAVFRDSTSGNEVGTIVFEDQSNTDLEGNAKRSSSVVLSDSVSLGNIVLGDDGTVVIPVSDIAASVAPPPTAAAAFNMSGLWKASAYANKPTGYITTCAAGTPQNDCEGLPEGSKIALLRMGGKLFTPTAGHCDQSANPVVCDESEGTVGTADRFALAVWEAEGFAACGYKTGFTPAEARAGGKINLTDTLPVIDGHQVAVGSLDGYNPYFWISSAATSPYSINDCSGQSIDIGGKSIPAYVCKGQKLDHTNVAVGGNAWMVNLGNGGCFDESNKPIFMTNWSGITGSCTNDSTGLPAGFSKGTCAYTGDPDGTGPQSTINFTCRWVNGQFADNAGAPDFATPLDTSYHVGPPVEKVAAGASCGNQTTGSGAGLTFDEARCYANYYYQHKDSFSSTCSSEPRFNWGANTVENFFKVDFRPKPKAQFLLDVITYDNTGNLATMDTEERESFEVSSGASSSITCEAARKIVFNVKKTGESTAIIDIRFSGSIKSTSAACQAVAKRALENIEFNKTAAESDRRRATENNDLEHILAPQKMIFSMTKE